MSNKNPFTNPEMQQYFASLPAFVQETIEQSGVQFDSLEQLRTFVDSLNSNN
ncbi:MAG: hypothetical protein GX485_07095 [Clostridiales bacterium]|jgi:hypothetical protein|nr:hypothetical protein [Clostridiales bacterium]